MMIGFFMLQGCVSSKDSHPELDFVEEKSVILASQKIQAFSSDFWFTKSLAILMVNPFDFLMLAKAK